MGVLKGIFDFYKEGFKTMPSWARSLWVIILVKLFIMFAVLKLFFFRDTLKNRFENDQQRADHVLEELVNTKPQ